MVHWKAIVDELALRVGRMRGVQYRVVCIVVVVTGAMVMCTGPVQTIIAPSSRLLQEEAVAAALRAEHASLQKQMQELDGKLSRLRDGLGETTAPPSHGHNDLVHVIDRASREARVHVGGLQALGAPTLRGRSMPQRYQLAVSGEYSAIAKFITAVSSEQSPVVIVEVEIHSPGWTYPALPLAAKFLVETIVSP